MRHALLLLCVAASACTEIDEVDCDDVRPDAVVQLTDEGFVPEIVTIEDDDVVEFVNLTGDGESLVANQTRDGDDFDTDDPDFREFIEPGGRTCAVFRATDDERFEFFSPTNPQLFGGGSVVVREDD